MFRHVNDYAFHGRDSSHTRTRCQDLQAEFAHAIRLGRALDLFSRRRKSCRQMMGQGRGIDIYRRPLEGLMDPIHLRSVHGHDGSQGFISVKDQEGHEEHDKVGRSQ